MTEQFPIEPSRRESAADATPTTEEQVAQEQAEKLEQPIPPQSVAVDSGRNITWAILAGVLILGGGTALIRFSFWYAKSDRDDQSAELQASQKTPEEGTDLLPQSPTSQGTNSNAASVSAANERGRREAEAKRREEETRRQERVVAFRAVAEKTQRNLITLRTVTNDWQTLVAALLENPEGRRLAGSASSVELFAGLYGQERLKASDLEAFQERLTLLRQPLQSAESSASESYAPSRELAQDVQNLDAEIQARVRQYRQDRLAIESLLDSRANEPPSEISLQAAMAAFRKSVELRRIETVAEARRKAQAESDRTLAEAETAKVEAEKKVRLLEIQAQQAEAERARQAVADKIQAADDAHTAALKNAELTREFEKEWPDMRGLLVPFTTSGYAQPGGYGFQETAEKGPVSFSKIKGAGMLKKEVESLKKLQFVTTANGMNDRDHGAFPRTGLQSWDRDRETIMKVQDFLNRFGAIMVEKKRFIRIIGGDQYVYKNS